MILHGKALQGFSEWLYKEKRLPLADLHKMDFEENIFLNALIIEWFDSVGIYITPNRAFSFQEWNYEIIGYFISGFVHDSREKATTEAIKKANEIYNSL